MSVWIHVCTSMFSLFSVFLLFFFFLAAVVDFSSMNSAYQWVPCTIYGTYKFHFSAIFSLKMGSTELFTRLNIILL